MNEDAISTRRFVWLTNQRGYSHVPEHELERVIAVRDTRPDFFVDTRLGVAFLAEVKSFQERSAPDAPSMFVRDSQRRVNAGPVESAAQQLARYANLGMPLVIVLDNHRQSFLNLDRTALIQIFGSLQYEITLSGGLIREEGWTHNSKDYAVGDRRRPYVSAIMVNIPALRFDGEKPDDFSVERPMRVHIIHNPDAAHPLPLWVFSAPSDKQIIRLNDRWVEFQCPPAQVTHGDIAKRAFELFQNRGSRCGSDISDWLEAERAARADLDEPTGTEE